MPSGPMDQQSVTDTYNKAYGLNTARLDPQWKQNESMNATALQNQGIMQGSEAWKNAQTQQFMKVG
jgi:hypothetical protein